MDRRSASFTKMVWGSASVCVRTGCFAFGSLDFKLSQSFLSILGGQKHSYGVGGGGMPESP